MHANSHKFCIGHRGLQVFPWWILPQWRQFIKKLRKMGFDSCNWGGKKASRACVQWLKPLSLLGALRSQSPFISFCSIVVYVCVNMHEGLTFVSTPLFLSVPSTTSWRRLPAKMIIPQVLISFPQDNKWEWRGVK